MLRMSHRLFDVFAAYGDRTSVFRSWAQHNIHAVPPNSRHDSLVAGNLDLASDADKWWLIHRFFPLG